MTQPPERHGGRVQLPTLAVLFALVAVLLVELRFLREVFNTDAYDGDGRWWAVLIWSTRYAFDLGVALAGGAVLFAGLALRRAYRQAGPRRPALAQVVLFTVAHLIVFAALWPLTDFALHQMAGRDTAHGLWTLAWFATLGLWALAWFGAIFDLGALWRAARSIPTALAISALAGAAAFGLSQILRETTLWQPLGHATLWLAGRILELVADEPWIDPGAMILGTDRFSIVLTRWCTGYEGIGLFWVFGTAYLWLFRADLRFPRALLILPLGTLVVWVANALRLVLLIGIGDRGHEELAIGGFHSHAGWILFTLISLGVVALTRRSTFFSRSAEGHPRAGTVNPAAAWLGPLFAVLAVTMVVGAVAGDSQRFYPLKVIAAAAVLWLFRREYGRQPWSFAPHALLWGLGAFALFLTAGLIRGGEVGPLPSSPLWWGMRVVGSLITVPLAEELAFRGFLLRRLISVDFEAVPPTRFTWASFLFSSLAFGLLHSLPVAGTLSGMLFACAVLRRGRLADAVLAHALANALLLAVAWGTGRWDLWL